MVASNASAPLPRGPRQRDLVARLGIHAVIIILCAFVVFPFLWMMSTSFKPANEVFTKTIQLFPQNPTFSNFPDAFAIFPVANWLWNSFVIAVLTMAGKIAISVPAAFAFARISFPGRRLLFSLVLATMIVPAVVTVIPNYVMTSQLGLLNTWAGVIIPSLPASAFFVFLLRQNILTLPQDLLDAARLDGASTVRVLVDIVVPNIRGGIAVVAVLSFLGAWNQYLWPLLVLSDFDSKTLATGMQFFTANSESVQLWGPMMATAVIAVIPPLALYALAQKQLIGTMINSGMRG